MVGVRSECTGVAEGLQPRATGTQEARVPSWPWHGTCPCGRNTQIPSPEGPEGPGAAEAYLSPRLPEARARLSSRRVWWPRGDLLCPYGDSQPPWVAQAAEVGSAGYRVGPLMTESCYCHGYFIFISLSGSPDSKGNISAAASLQRAEKRGVWVSGIFSAASPNPQTQSCSVTEARAHGDCLGNTVIL